MSLTFEQQKQKAARMRARARANPSNLLETLQEALSFVESYSEDWYYTGQELCGRLECEIHALTKKIEPFVVRHYSEDERPSIKGNGFDGLSIGEERWEAEQFVEFVNKAILNR